MNRFARLDQAFDHFLEESLSSGTDRVSGLARVGAILDLMGRRKPGSALRDVRDRLSRHSERWECPTA
ncbi:hypothetical protein DFR52_101763 [Hoeflea marina]|uniref:Uncharacterized protein n=1 Tax=Hoeflea marina TaxID=274592 RepID=A0A317PRG5_9HYPH|nr:hypothetical protein [Hoeflea marina]PWW04073.1 hypothetical protein DFR52_101763 [Hoeflea marina]